jgi:hypothetical protein
MNYRYINEAKLGYKGVHKNDIFQFTICGYVPVIMLVVLLTDIGVS